MEVVTARCDFGRGLHIRIADRTYVIMTGELCFCSINECQDSIHSSLQQNKVLMANKKLD